MRKLNNDKKEIGKSLIIVTTIFIFCLPILKYLNFSMNYIIYIIIMLIVLCVLRIMLCRSIEKNIINRYKILFKPEYKNNSIKPINIETIKEFGTTINYDEINISKHLKNKIIRFERDYNIFLELCYYTEDYNEMERICNLLNKRYDKIFKELTTELQEEFIINISQHIKIPEDIGYNLIDYDTKCGNNIGVLKVMKDKKTNKLYIYCLECNLFWENPKDALNGENNIRVRKHSNLVNVTYDEIVKAGWEDYVVEK